MMPAPMKRRLMAIAAFWLALVALGFEAAADSRIPPRPVADRWAVVESDGTLARYKGAVSSAMLGRGLYEVVFGSSVRSCVYLATLGNPGAGTPPAGTISVAPRGGVPNGVLVITRNLAGSAVTPAGFHLFVSCPRVSLAADAEAEEEPAVRAAIGSRLGASDRWAVISAAGDVMYGRGVVEYTPLDEGNELVFDKNVTGCAYIASQSGPTYDSGWLEGQVSVASRGRRTPKGVYVRLTHANGAAHLGLEFTLLVKCP